MASTVVLVHGAWHGAWCWDRVKPLLEAEGHRVCTPTQIGLGERAHLLSDRIDLSAFVDDIARLLVGEDLRDVVLVGHSFAGASIIGVADRMPERLRQLVFLDALIVGSGETPFSKVPPQVAQQRIAAAEAHDGGLSIPIPPVSAFGMGEPEDIAWVTPRLTPHPLRTFQTSLTLEHPVANGVPATYVICSEPVYGPLESSRRWARNSGWPIVELATGHDAMVTAPRETAELLCRLAG